MVIVSEVIHKISNMKFPGVSGDAVIRDIVNAKKQEKPFLFLQRLCCFTSNPWE